MLNTKKLITTALLEDRALADITSDLTIPKNTLVTFEINAREEIIFCGTEIISEVFSQLKKSSKFKNSKLDLKILAKDGEKLAAKKTIARGRGDARLIFAGERVILNLIQHLSGVATLTKKFVEALGNKKIQILDTRKTLAGLRELQKYAVKTGGGKNHRMNLSDLILVKDNHIAAAGGIKNAIAAAKKAPKKIQIEVECDNFEQVAEAVESFDSGRATRRHGPDIIMLDNMSVAEIKKCATLIRKKSAKIKIEISGGITLANIKKFSQLDIDFISVGALTHSAKAVDIGLDIN
jgi:nicotinate-nucleotide pyrophosphorylase (carboxylating)